MKNNQAGEHTQEKKAPFTQEQLSQLTKRQKNMVILGEEYNVDFQPLITPDEDGCYLSENRVIIGRDFEEYMADYFLDFENEILQAIPKEDYDEDFCKISGTGNRQYFSFGDGEEVYEKNNGEICDFSSYKDFPEEDQRRFYFHEYINTDGRPVRLYEMITLSEIQ